MIKKIDFKDLFKFIGIGLLMALLGGIISGLLDWILSYINLYISFSIVILIYFVAYRMRSVYSFYHIIYPILALVFFYLGLVFCDITSIVLNLGFQSLGIVINPMFFLEVLLEPIFDIYLGIKILNASQIVVGIINLAVYGFAYFYTFKITKGRN